MITPYNPFRFLFYPLVLLLLGGGIYLVYKKNPALMDQLSLIEKQRTKDKMNAFTVKTPAAETDLWNKSADVSGADLNNDLAHPEALRVDHRYDSYKDGPTIPSENGFWHVDAHGIVTSTSELVRVFDVKGDLLWELKGAKQAKFCTEAPAMTAAVVVVCRENGGVTAFSRAKGHLLWESHDEQTYWRNPVIIEKSLYTFVKGDKTWTLKKGLLESGESLKQMTGLPMEMSGRPTFSKGIMVLVEKSGTIRGYSLLDMKPMWKSEIAAEFNAPIGISGDRIYAVTSEGMIHCLDLRNGSQIWEYSISQPSSQGVSLIPSLMIGAITDNNGYLHMLDLKTGKRKWRFNTNTKNKMRQMMAVRLEGANATKLNMGTESRGWMFWGPCKDYEICAFEPFKGFLVRRFELKEPVVFPPLYLGSSGYLTVPVLKDDQIQFKMYADRDLLEAEEQNQPSNPPGAVDKPQEGE